MSEAMERTESRRGRRRVTDPLHLTPSERVLLRWVSEHDDGLGALASKRSIAEVMGKNVKTIDRAVCRLRRLGMIEAVPRYGASGGQVSNAYRVTLLAQRTYPEVLDKG